MARALPKLSKNLQKKFERTRRDSSLMNVLVRDLSDYFSVFHALSKDDTFWFRGHADYRWGLTPSALRAKKDFQRTKALELLSAFKRAAEFKLQPAFTADDDLKWMQLGQHYGLPTRLLDWTRNAAIALWFACMHFDNDGVVYIVNPIDLNRVAGGQGISRIYDGHRDKDVISKYFALDGRVDSNGLMNIAINPGWNSERIILQQGTFTLHGSREFPLTKKQAPSLVYIPILKDMKVRLFEELGRIGIGEMFIFPEADHICSHLKREAGIH